jgi:hypothetical protein
LASVRKIEATPLSLRVAGFEDEDEDDFDAAALETIENVDSLLVSCRINRMAFVAIEIGGRTQRWEGSRPRPAAAGLFPKPSVFVDRVIGIRLVGTSLRRERIRLRLLIENKQNSTGYVGQAARPPGQGPANACALRLTPTGSGRTKAMLFMGQDISVSRNLIEP